MLSHRRQNARRLIALRKVKGLDGHPPLNGIDYLEVAEDRRTLQIYFIHPLPGNPRAVPANAPALTAENIRITSRTRVRSLSVEFATALDNLLTVRINLPGDRSVYTLRLVQSARNLDPPDGFDSQLAQVDFVFQVDDSSELDCNANLTALPDKPPPIPPIDYLGKDYASFRQLMLNRLTITMPQWRERNPADMGIMLVELLAYVADQLSYYQDAVATEAYLSTARRRVSVRRHARLLDYFIHNGRNARVWVTIQIIPSLDGYTLLGPAVDENRPGTCLTTYQSQQTGLSPVQTESATTVGQVLRTMESAELDGYTRLEPSTLTSLIGRTGLTAEQFESALPAVQVFETMQDVTLYAAQNAIEIYPWGAEEYTLPKGATQATLKDTGGQLRQQLQPGTVLIFEQLKGRTTGKREDADPTRRHAVRLIRVTPQEDRLRQEASHDSGDLVTRPQSLVQVEWSAADALPFEVWVTCVVAGEAIDNISIVRGNVVLADHGRTLPPVELPPVLAEERYRPPLLHGPLTQQGPLHRSRVAEEGSEIPVSATEILQHLPLRDLQPSVWLRETDNPTHRWQSQVDLLVSDRFARDFVVEVEEDGRAYLRFGDNQLGRQPEPGTRFQATYRIGNGVAGNVGAGAIAHLYPAVPGIVAIRNPLPASGGIEPEPLEQVKFQAPHAFRERQCAVTEADYAELAQGFPGVQRAVATRRWTGSWDTIFITVDRMGGARVDPEFRRELLTYLERFRLTAHRLEIDNPRFVPLDLGFRVQVRSGYFRRDLRSRLDQAFSPEVQPNGQLGFFHPDLHTFGQSIYLSEIIKTVMQVAGVQSVEVTRFQRLWQPPRDELARGELVFDRLEIPVLRNDPSAPEDGRIAFELEGGLEYE